MTRHAEPFNLAVPVNSTDHALGPDDARVTLVEYGDFQCPNCGQAYPAVKLLLKRFEHRARFVFRHFPLTDVHAHAELAAESAARIRPRLAVPVHWGDTSARFEAARRFCELCAARGIPSVPLLAGRQSVRRGGAEPGPPSEGPCSSTPSRTGM